MPSKRNSSRASSSLSSRGHKGDVHSLGAWKLVWIQFGKHQLFGQSQAVVAVAVEGVRVQPAKVTDTRQGQRNQAIEELVHPLAAQASPCSRSASLRAGGNRRSTFASLRDDRLLAGDLRQRGDGVFQVFLLGDRRADAHVDDDLLQSRQRQSDSRGRAASPARAESSCSYFSCSRGIIAHGVDPITSWRRQLVAERSGPGWHRTSCRTVLWLPSSAVAGAEACRLVALRADQQHVGDLDRHLLRQPAALRIPLAAAHVLVDPIDAFDDQLAGLAIDRSAPCRGRRGRRR